MTHPHAGPKRKRVRETWSEAQRRSFAFGNCNIENPKVTREIVNEEAETMSACNFHGLPFLDCPNYRKARATTMADSKDAPVTEEHRVLTLELVQLGAAEAAQFLANLQRHWQAAARLEQHMKECPWCCLELKTVHELCDRGNQLERERVEAKQ